MAAFTVYKPGQSRVSMSIRASPPLFPEAPARTFHCSFYNVAFFVARLAAASEQRLWISQLLPNLIKLEICLTGASNVEPLSHLLIVY